MHELGIVTHVMKTVKEVGREQNLTRVSAVTLEVGEVSGVVFDYLESCWKWSVNREDAGILRDSVLRCQVLPGVSVCEDCRKTYSTVQHGKACPYCGGESTFLVSGNELNIKEIEGV